MVNRLPHILAVDDNNRNQQIMLGILEDEYNVNFAYSGQSCLENISDFTPDLILLDIMMPGLDGYEVCQQLKAQERTRDIPVIFVSGKDALEDRIKGLEAGADDYIVKPFDHDNLLVSIRKTLDKVAQKAQSAEQEQQASSLAFQVMQENSSMGTVLRFLQASFIVHDYDELVKALLVATGELGLSCSVQIRVAGTIINAIDHGEMSPLEETILTQATHSGRFFDFRQGTIVNYEHISLLVKNMPGDDDERYSVIKDNVCRLLDGAEARIKALWAAGVIQRHKACLLDASACSSEVLNELRDSYQQMSTAAATIAEDVVVGVNESITHLSLGEDQQKNIEGIATRGLQRTKELFSNGIGIDEKFARLTAMLHQVNNVR